MSFSSGLISRSASIFGPFMGAVALSSVLAASGCSKEAPKPKAEEKHADAAHPEAGPHGGSLIELGKEEFHAELVHDEKAGEVTFYILDGAAKIAVPIDATEVLVNLKHDGKGEQFKVAAKPTASDPAGKSSCFFSADKELAGDLDHAGADPQLVITINGKQFRGAIGHEHAEAGHADHKK